MKFRPSELVWLKTPRSQPRPTGLTQPLTYSLAAGAPPGAGISPVTGVFTWTPKVPGVYNFTVVVTDVVSGATASFPISLTH